MSTICVYATYFGLLTWHAEKYDACDILTGLLCYLPSDVPLIGKQKLKKCAKFWSLTLLWQQSSLIGEASASLPQDNEELTFQDLLSDTITLAMQLHTLSILSV